MLLFSGHGEFETGLLAVPKFSRELGLVSNFKKSSPGNHVISDERGKIGNQFQARENMKFLLSAGKSAITEVV